MELLVLGMQRLKIGIGSLAAAISIKTIFGSRKGGAWSRFSSSKISSRRVSFSS